MTHEYQVLTAASAASGENRDCTVKALALSCGISYEEARISLRRRGRIKGRGFSMAETLKEIKSRGFKLLEIERELPNKHLVYKVSVAGCADGIIKNRLLSEAKTVRTLERVLPQKGILVIWTGSHVLVAKGGKIQDWSQERCLRIKMIWQVTK